MTRKRSYETLYFYNARGRRMGKVRFFTDIAGEWRWRLVRSNGRTVADSGEGYKTKGGCKQGFRSAMELGFFGVQRNGGTRVI